MKNTTSHMMRMYSSIMCIGMLWDLFKGFTLQGLMDYNITSSIFNYMGSGYFS
jgi:hypothetical protein